MLVKIHHPSTHMEKVQAAIMKAYVKDGSDIALAMFQVQCMSAGNALVQELTSQGVESARRSAYRLGLLSITNYLTASKEYFTAFNKSGKEIRYSINAHTLVPRYPITEFIGVRYDGPDIHWKVRATVLDVKFQWEPDLMLIEFTNIAENQALDSQLRVEIVKTGIPYVDRVFYIGGMRYDD